MTLTKNFITEQLRAGEFIFSFEKKDGTVRLMRGTTNLEKIPESHHPKGAGSAKPDSIINVFDLDLKEWRSFRFDPTTFSFGSSVENLYNKQENEG